MRAMILAAGRGERMGDLTQTTPKPLLKVGGHYLIEYVITNLVRAHIKEVVINISYLGEQIKMALGDGSRYGVHIHYSEEAERLETGGGILQALPLLGAEPFMVISGDIITDYSLLQLPRHPAGLAHLVMVKNPAYHPQGDFGLQDDRVNMTATPTYTFANIAIYRPELFSTATPGHFRLTKLLIPAILSGRVTGELYHGMWHNIGSPQDLASINQLIEANAVLKPQFSTVNS